MKITSKAVKQPSVNFLMLIMQCIAQISCRNLSFC